MTTLSGVTFGAFDLLHVGHIIFLRRAKEYLGENGELTVGLHIDPSIERPEKNKPVQSVFERYIQLGHLNCVDKIIPYATEQELDYILRTFKFDKRFLGDEYQNDWAFKRVGSQNTCVSLKTDIVFIPRFHHYSSSELRNRIQQNFISKGKYD